ncbi:MAG: universal stress protein [Anaerolineae bacterium]|nr:universal stress protein [Anaerolineae bacterium]
MYKTILVPLDGSELSEQAIPVAAALAKPLDATVVLTQAVYMTTLPGGALSDVQVTSMDEVELYLKTKATPLIEAGLKVEVGVPYAPPVEGILDEINLRGADVVVMTTHGRSGLSRLIYGSVAEAVLHHSPVPVLLIRAGVKPELVPLSQPQPVFLVPLDGSSFAEEALPHAMAFAQAFQGELALMHVYEPPILTEQDIVTHTDKVGRQLTKEQEEVEAYIAGLAHNMRQMGLNVRTDLRSGDIVQSILEEEYSADAALVIMATHGRTGLRRALFGSVALDVLRRGGLPMLLIRPAEFVVKQAKSEEKAEAEGVAFAG